MRPLRRSSIAALSTCGVTPALARILAASVPFSMRDREQQTLDRDIGIARLLRRSFRHCRRAARSSARYRAGRRPRPATFGSLPSASSVCVRASRELPPALSIRPLASPSGSSSSTLSRCSGVNCWLFSRTARDCALCTNPRARSVYFSKFILPRPPNGKAVHALPHANSASEHPTADLTGDLGKRRGDW